MTDSNDQTPTPAPQYNLAARRELAARNYADLTGMTSGAPFGQRWPTDAREAWQRRQAGIALGIYLGDKMAEILAEAASETNSGRLTGHQLGTAITEVLRELDSAAYEYVLNE